MPFDSVFCIKKELKNFNCKLKLISIDKFSLFYIEILMKEGAL